MVPVPSLDPVLILACGIYRHPYLKPTLTQVTDPMFYTCIHCSTLFIVDHDDVMYLDRWAVVDSDLGYAVGPGPHCMDLPVNFTVDTDGVVRDSAGIPHDLPDPADVHP